MKTVDTFYLNKEEPNKSCFIELRNIILKHAINITETVKYGMPCFCYKGKVFCYLWVDKKKNNPYLLFVEGHLLNNLKLVQGSRAKMKIFSVNPLKDIPIKTIKSILNEALDLYKNGIIKIK